MTDKEKPNFQSHGQCAVGLWRSNWIYMAAEHELSGVSYGISDNALYETLVELISGGSVTYDDIAADPDKYSSIHWTIRLSRMPLLLR